MLYNEIIIDISDNSIYDFDSCIEYSFSVNSELRKKNFNLDINIPEIEFIDILNIQKNDEESFNQELIKNKRKTLFRIITFYIILKFYLKLKTQYLIIDYVYKYFLNDQKTSIDEYYIFLVNYARTLENNDESISNIGEIDE